MPRDLTYEQYPDDSAYHVVNPADRTGDRIDDHPVIGELQRETRAGIWRAIRNPTNVAVKVTPLRPPMDRVKGYATVARFLLGRTPREFEDLLGMRKGVLGVGCRVFVLDATDIAEEDIGPRGFTSWSAGVTPRELHRLSERAGAPVGYHRDYPAAREPIPQFTLFRPVKVRSSRFLRYDEIFDRV